LGFANETIRTYDNADEFFRAIERHRHLFRFCYITESVWDRSRPTPSGLSFMASVRENVRSTCGTNTTEHVFTYVKPNGEGFSFRLTNTWRNNQRMFYAHGGGTANNFDAAINTFKILINRD